MPRSHWTIRTALFAGLALALPAPAGTALGSDDGGEQRQTLRQHLANMDDEPALTVNEPMYFIIGRRDGGDTTARFQLSFKYRLLDAESAIVDAAPWLGRLHFGYTQTSLWNWSADGYPFEDTSYRPSLFWEFGSMHQLDRAGYLRFGVEHESNGQAGDPARSMDTLFIMPGVSLDAFGRELVVSTRVFTYLNKGSENRDIQQYRGYGDLIVRYGDDDSWVLQAMYRHGTGGNSTTQVDLSIPIRERIFARTGAYIYIQAFEGYGETLRDYDQRASLGGRIGVAFVR
ncbi:phospholipase A [Aquisalimonas asiatica]|uniref:Phospholipase A1 n=1 Tax=Aquisalimonas asiatica TaxID=406100 RepID=A0A1H8V760_9GAMM|nr:phospholipase A [Aquisalimonas asiatica]SEP11083.1 Phospholipase A1 [Aquisalimonas asiatica]